MDLKSLATSEISQAVDEYKKLVDNHQILNQLTKAAQMSAESISKGGIVFFAGNGGSFADAQHMAAELTGKMGRMRISLPGIVLGANSSSMSAIGNDFGYEYTFSRELEGLHRPSSIVIGFSTSGNSKNMEVLAQKSHEFGIPMFCFTGENLGTISKFCEVIRVPSERTERVQEMHTLLGHLLCLLVEEQLGLV